MSMMKLLMADTGGLAGSIDSLGNVKGLSKAEQMAKAMVDPWDRWSAGITAVQIGIGQSLLPVLNPLIEMLSDTLAEMAGWTQMYPDRKSTRLNSSHQINSYAVFCLKKKKQQNK